MPLYAQDLAKDLELPMAAILTLLAPKHFTLICRVLKDLILSELPVSHNQSWERISSARMASL